MGSEITRKLASIQKIQEIKPIEGADAIEACRVLDWWVVAKKDDFKVGDPAVYLCIDSWVPHELAPFLSKGSVPREYNGVKGNRLKTIRLRGQVSQGLLLHTDQLVFAVETKSVSPERVLKTEKLYHEDADLTEILGIQKWEAPIPSQLQGQCRGTFPTGLIPKTDQERIQNCFKDIQQKGDVTYEVTIKLDGSSMTIFRWESVLRVCSRNMELIIDESNASNSFVAMANEIGDRIPEGYAFQGEIYGESIQGNKERVKGHHFAVFDIFDMNRYEYLAPMTRRHMCETLGLDHVPVLGENWKAPDSVDEALKLATGPSINAKYREGIVFKCNENPNFSFKVISNEWLLKYSE